MRILLMAVVLACAGPGDAREFWRCHRNGAAVELRDTPCPEGGLVSEKRVRYGPGRFPSRGTFNSFEPVPVPEVRTRTPAPRDGSRRRPVRAESGARAVRCADAERRIKAINRRLRKGYSAREGNELRAERRRLDAFIGDACR